jgi:23S rRNA pseudouridine2605 synthase
MRQPNWFCRNSINSVAKSMEERLQKILAQWGIASRRHAERLILEGQVRVNGNLAVLGQKVNPETDIIEANGKRVGGSGDRFAPRMRSDLSIRPTLIYLLLHKPLGVVSTCADPQGRPTVLDLLPSQYHGVGLHPVGRLDIQTTGALLLTNDGDLTFHLTHPSRHITKTYAVWVQGNPSPSVLNQWRKGIMLEGRQTRPAQVEILAPFNRQQNATQLQIILQEGRKRQIRLVAKALGHQVLQLHRTHIGPIALLDIDECILSPGQYRSLTSSEIKALSPTIRIEDRAATPKEPTP